MDTTPKNSRSGASEIKKRGSSRLTPDGEEYHHNYNRTRCTLRISLPSKSVNSGWQILPPASTGLKRKGPFRRHHISKWQRCRARCLQGPRWLSGLWLCTSDPFVFLETSRDSAIILFSDNPCVLGWFASCGWCIKLILAENTPNDLSEHVARYYFAVRPLCLRWRIAFEFSKTIIYIIYYQACTKSWYEIIFETEP